jgi:subtilisin-like proprotein convertase family protein
LKQKSDMVSRITVAQKKVIKTCICLAAVFAVCNGAVNAQTPPTTSTSTFTVNKTIPDGNSSGVSDTQTLNFAPQQLYNITDVQVTLNISGGFNGDYYGYLVHDSSFVVLLNRPGKTAGNPVGYSDSGLTITLSAASPNDIHTYETVSNPGGGVLTGIWAPDGRNVDPSVVLDTDPQTTSLSSLVGDDPSGDWTLFLADLDYGEQGTLTSWGLVVTAVPEPGTLGLLALGLGGLAGMRWLRRRG